MNKKIQATAIIQSQPGKSDALRAALLDLVAETVTEPGCELFKIGQNNDNPEEFILWEIFSSQEALQEHMGKNYTKKVFSLQLITSIKAIHLSELKQ